MEQFGLDLPCTEPLLLPLRLETSYKYSDLLCVSSCSCTERGKPKNLCSLWRLSYCEEIPVEENEVNDSSSKSSMEAKPEASPQLPKKSVTASTLTSTGSSEAPASVSVLPPSLGSSNPAPWDPAGTPRTYQVTLPCGSSSSAADHRSVVSVSVAFGQGKVSKACLA